MDNLGIAYNAEESSPKAIVTSSKCYGWAGAAGMLIAYAECLLSGYQPSMHMFGSCIDIDPVAADMAFIQMSCSG
jgi:hypothetical protein